MIQSVAGILIGTPRHHYDHIASFCVYTGTPLLVSDVVAQEELERLYPGLLVLYKDLDELPAFALTNFKAFVSCSPRPFLLQYFGYASETLGKPFLSIFLHHGNSDKGYASALMEGMQYETHTLIYGRKMEEFMKEKKVFSQLHGVATIGNFRERVFTLYRKHFESLLSFTKTKKTVLFAPTWEDSENSCSFFDAINHLLSNKPQNISLLIKPHPNTVEQHTSEMEVLQGGLPKDVHFITDFPPVYTLLNLADVYIGDMSSVGYDFLTYNRPMFFLNKNKRDPATDPGLALFHCGDILYPSSFDAVYEIIEDPQIDKKHLRHKMYLHTFDQAPSKGALLHSISQMERSFV